MKFNLSNLSAVLLASGMLMSTAVTAAPLIIPGSLIWMTTLIQWGGKSALLAV